MDKFKIEFIIVRSIFIKFKTTHSLSGISFIDHNVIIVPMINKSH
jgi:hypothetical protein